MTTQEKLQIIKTLSGLTQTRLATTLGVSFPTLNSWINGHSIPHKSHEETINNFYRELTGQKIIPKESLSAKMDIILKHSKSCGNILQTILQNPDIYDELILQITYNTNRIEGSTLTKAETADILFENKTIRNKKLTEQLEAKNHQTALEYLLAYLAENKKIDEELILKLHGTLMSGIRDDAGFYRHHPVRIVGSNVPTANYLRVPNLMKKLTKKIAQKEKDFIGQVAEIHSEFEQIHPFSDGNGRVGRLIMIAMVLRKNITPPIILQKNRRPYFKYLREAQLKRNFSPLKEFILDAILFGLKIIRR